MEKLKNLINDNDKPKWKEQLFDFQRREQKKQSEMNRSSGQQQKKEKFCEFYE